MDLISIEESLYPFEQRQTQYINGARIDLNIQLSHLIDEKLEGSETKLTQILASQAPTLNFHLSVIFFRLCSSHITHLKVVKNPYLNEIEVVINQ